MYIYNLPNEPARDPLLITEHGYFRLIHDGGMYLLWNERLTRLFDFIISLFVLNEIRYFVVRAKIGGKI